MPLKVELTIEQTDLLMQQNPSCKVRLSNVGPTDLVLATKPPPTYRIVDAATGIEVRHRRGAHVPALAAPVVLKSGEATEVYFNLKDEIPLKLPGRYDVSVIYPYNAGVSSGESDPVRVQIRAFTPRSLALSLPNGGFANTVFGACINVASDPPEIVRARFELAPKGGVGDVRALGPGALRSRPVLSAPANLDPVGSQFVAWIDKDQLRWVHFDDALGSTAPASFKLPGETGQIVDSLFSASIVDTTVRPDGAALIVLGTVGEPNARLMSLRLTHKNASSMGWTTLTGGAPGFIRSFTKSSGPSQVLLINTKPGAMVLLAGAWPGAEGAPPPMKLADVPGDLIAADVIVTAEDEVHGAILAHVGAGVPRTLQAMHWVIRPNGALTITERRDIPWDENLAIEHAEIRANARVSDAALIRGGDGKWLVFTPQNELVPVPSEVEATKQPLSLAFLGETEPVLIAGQLMSGFKVMRLDGSGMPGHTH